MRNFENCYFSKNVLLINWFQVLFSTVNKWVNAGMFDNSYFAILLVLFDNSRMGRFSYLNIITFELSK
jgi:hypothetical protein